jgi:hypothetical protein
MFAVSRHVSLGSSVGVVASAIVITQEARP